MKKRKSNNKRRSKSYKKVLNKKNRLYVYKKSILNRITIKIIDNPVEKAIIYYNKVTLRYINCDTNNFTLKRITMNYIRHKLTNYDIEISRLGSKSNHINLLEFKRNINDCIKSKYSDNFIENEIDYLREIKQLCCI